MNLYIIYLITTLQGAECIKLLIGDRESLYTLDTDKNTSTPLIQSDSPQSVGFDFSRGYIYYVDNQSQLRRLGTRSTDKPITLNVPRADINEVVVDWLNNKLYLIRNGRTVLTKTNSRGVDGRDIVNKDTLNSFEGTISKDDDITIKHVEVDPYDKFIFLSIMEVSFSQHFYAIAKANLNGEYLRAAIGRTFRHFIAFTIDVNTKRLYVAGKQRLFIYDYQGERIDVKLLRSDFIKIKVLQYNLYGFIKQMRNNIYKVELESSGTDGLQPQKLPSENVQFDQILSFHLYDPRTQRRVTDGQYLCDRQDCSHSCEVSPRFGDSCLCQSGKVIAVDGRTCQECGQSGLNSYANQPTIIGGNFSAPGNFPWHAIIYHLDLSDKWQANCGGTLISPRLILTAAHCVTTKCSTCKPPPMSINKVMVALGKTNRSFLVEEEKQVRKRLKAIRPHELYLGTSTSHAHDIAIVETESDVRFNIFVMPACLDFNLNYQQQLFEDRTMEGFVAGFGNTQECGAHLSPCDQPSDFLKYIKTNIITYEECFNRSQSLDKTVFLSLTNDKFCAGNGFRSVIQSGDSGGGLTFVFNGLHFLYGIVSTKLYKASKNGDLSYSFSAFTDVAIHLDWIKSIIE